MRSIAWYTRARPFVEAVKCVASALVKIVRHGVPEYRARWQIDPNRHLQRTHEAGGDLVLNFEYFVEILVVGSPG